MCRNFLGFLKRIEFIIIDVSLPTLQRQNQRPIFLYTFRGFRYLQYLVINFDQIRTKFLRIYLVFNFLLGFILQGFKIVGGSLG